jgi:hypothetical protein
MSWKPSEIEIIDYLYGDLSPEMNNKFEDYLKQNTDFAKEVDELRLTQNILPNLPEEEVIPPLPISGTTKMSSVRKTDRKWLYPVSIAASIAAILLVGYFTQFSIAIGENGFKMTFNENQLKIETQLTKDEILSLIDNKVNLATDDLKSEMTNMESSFASLLEQNHELTESEIKRVALLKPQTQIDEAQILTFINQLKDENKKAMQNFYQANADNQQTYMRNILLDFNEYLDEQRKKDLQYIQANMLEIKNTSELKQEETDKILANIITTVNNQNSAGR